MSRFRDIGRGIMAKATGAVQSKKQQPSPAGRATFEMLLDKKPKPTRQMPGTAGHGGIASVHGVSWRATAADL